MKKTLKSMLALVLCVVMVSSVLVSCTKPGETITPATFKQAEYNTFTATMPSNWNELTYADNNDTQILSYISSS